MQADTCPSELTPMLSIMRMQKRKDLTASEGHVLLLEYFEEYPLMLSHPGKIFTLFAWCSCLSAVISSCWQHVYEMLCLT